MSKWRLDCGPLFVSVSGVEQQPERRGSMLLKHCKYNDLCVCVCVFIFSEKLIFSLVSDHLLELFLMVLGALSAVCVVLEGPGNRLDF